MPEVLDIADAVKRHAWYHRIELPDGTVTPGWAPLSADAYRMPARMDGLRVLDVGTWDGYWAFDTLRRGAAEVVAIDDLSDPANEASVHRRPVPRTWETFDLCRELLGYDTSRCQRKEMSVYEVTPEGLGLFDVVLFYGTLYHMRYPLLALDRLSAVCSGSIRIESATLDKYSPYRGGMGEGYPGHQMVMEFYPGAEYGELETNWWVPTLQLLWSMVRAAGWPGLKAWHITDPPRDPTYCRGFVVGTKATGGNDE